MSQKRNTLGEATPRKRRRKGPPESPDLDKEAAQIYDRTMKIAIEADPVGILRLAGCEIDVPVRVANVAVNRSELRADSVLLVGDDEDAGRWAAYLEVQTWPDPSPMMSWQSKHAGLAVRTNRKTILLVVYLRRGGYRNLPDGYEMTEGCLTTSFHFSNMLLRDHAEEIRSGIVPGLAPFLVMCYDNPGPEVLEREREIILQSSLAEDRKVELLAAAIGLGGETFSKEVLKQVFERDSEMIKDKGLLKEWLDESRAEGEARGEATASRKALMAALKAKFENLPGSFVERVQTADAEWCLANLPRVVVATRVEELGW